MYSTVFQLETESCPYNMKALYACRPRIDYQHITLRIPDNLKNMRMSAYENVRSVPVDQFPCTGIIAAWVSPDMGHEDLQTFTFEETVQRVVIAESLIVTVSADADERLEGGQAGRQVHASAEVAGMPDLVHRLEESLELRVEHAVGI